MLRKATTPVVMASPLRRIGGLLSDSLIAMAIGVLATFPFVPFIHGKALVPTEVGLLAYFYRLWIALVLILFFSFFWTRKGQTVGMQAWRLKLERETGELLNWPQAIVRCVVTLLPWVPAWLAFALAEQTKWSWVLRVAQGLLAVGAVEILSGYFTKDGRTWTDRWSRSRVIEVPFAHKQ